MTHLCSGCESINAAGHRCSRVSAQLERKRRARIAVEQACDVIAHRTYTARMHINHEPLVERIVQQRIQFSQQRLLAGRQRGAQGRVALEQQPLEAARPRSRDLAGQLPDAPVDAVVMGEAAVRAQGVARLRTH
jgi:hypothetical protein